MTTDAILVLIVGAFLVFLFLTAPYRNVKRGPKKPPEPKKPPYDWATDAVDDPRYYDEPGGARDPAWREKRPDDI